MGNIALSLSLQRFLVGIAAYGRPPGDPRWGGERLADHIPPGASLEPILLDPMWQGPSVSYMVQRGDTARVHARSVFP